MVLWQAMAKRVGTDRQEKYMGKSGLRNRDGLEEGREGYPPQFSLYFFLRKGRATNHRGEKGPEGGGENKRARRG